MYCTNCGNPQPEQAAFCPYCGSRIAAAMTVAPAANQTAQPNTDLNGACAAAELAALPQPGYTAPQAPPVTYPTFAWQDGYAQPGTQKQGMKKGLFITLTSVGALAALSIGMYLGVIIANAL